MDKAISKKWFKILYVLIPVVLFNFIVSLFMVRLGLKPILGLAGSMVAAIVSGYFLGVWTSLISQLFISFFVDGFIYYSIVTILNVIITAFFYQKGYLKKRSGIFLFISLNAFISTVFTYVIEDQTGQFYKYVQVLDEYADIVDFLSMGIFARYSVIIFIYAFIFHSFNIFIALGTAGIIPDDIKDIFKSIGWLQKPVSDDELEMISKSETRKIKISTVFAISLIATCLLVLIVVAAEARALFVKHTKEEHKEIAIGASMMAAKAIDGDIIDEYISSGGQSDEYKEVVEKLENIRKISSDIEYIYAYKIMSDGCHVIFDLETETLKAGEPGEVVGFSDSFEEYLPTLLEGGEIEPIEADEDYGWLLTSYTPVYNSEGATVCYAGADVSMRYLNNYTRNFIIRLVIMCSGIIIVIIISGLWIAKFRVIYPVDSMVIRARGFKYDSEDARKANVESLSDLDIHTGDEIERLYNSFLQVTKDSMNSFSKMRQKTDYIEQMQSDLIVILADMVENRDESTGDHIKKTSMYTFIIMKQMRRMGIYSGLLTDDYIDNVIKSAPLHDIGKIRIPDAILNKPGKLTKEEFEIMKLHSTYGGEIIDHLIESLPEASYLEIARDIALYHHERWDGTGYPKGLKKEGIPLSARIMAVADVFDALISDRVYKKAFSFEKAMSIIEEESGTHFDPGIVKAFLAASDEVRETSEKFKNR